MKILIARHAEDKGPRYEDQERTLTSKGIEQAEKLAKIVENFNPTHIYSSALTRSRKTAQIIAKLCRTSFEENNLFDEQISGRSSEDSLSSGYVSLKESFRGGETYSELYQRVKNALVWIRNKHKSCSKDRIVLVTHGRFMTFFISLILGHNPDGFNLEIENTSYVIIKITDKWRPQLILPRAGEQYI